MPQDVTPRRTDDTSNMTHLGDGVYAEDDGYYIHLRVNSHLNPRVVALEAPVIVSLVEWARSRGMTIDV